MQRSISHHSLRATTSRLTRTSRCFPLLAKTFSTGSTSPPADKQAVPLSPATGKPLTPKEIEKLIHLHLLLPNYRRELIKDNPFTSIKPQPVEALTPEEKRAMLVYLPEWLEVANRNAIFRSFQFLDFKQAFHFMTRVSVFAEAIGHHPEWFNVYNRLEITLTTHDASGVSMRDIIMAAYLDRLFKTPIDALDTMSRWRATDKLFTAEDTLLNLRPEIAVPQMIKRPPMALLPDDMVSPFVLGRRLQKREQSRERLLAHAERRKQKRLLQQELDAQEEAKKAAKKRGHSVSTNAGTVALEAGDGLVEDEDDVSELLNSDSIASRAL